MAGRDLLWPCRCGTVNHAKRDACRKCGAERYNEMRGQTVWVAPFTKGKGLLIDKDYAVKGAP